MFERSNANSWYYSPDHGQLCQAIEFQTLWGETTCRADAQARLPGPRACGQACLEDAGTGTTEGIAYVAAGSRVRDAVTQDVQLSPIESSVISLLHQIRSPSRAIAGDQTSSDGLRRAGRVHYLLADEVGLGKTIEAGLILRELKLRRLVKDDSALKAKGKDRWRNPPQQGW